MLWPPWNPAFFLRRSVRSWRLSSRRSSCARARRNPTSCSISSGCRRRERFSRRRPCEGRSSSRARPTTSEKFQSLATEYLRRYRHSIYAGNFRQRLASALTRIDFGKETARFDGIVAMMSELEPDARRELYLLAARASIEQGWTTSARMTADKAQELAGQDKASAARAKLYRAASAITSPEGIGGAVEDLRSLDRSVLAAERSDPAGFGACDGRPDPHPAGDGGRSGQGGEARRDESGGKQADARTGTASIAIQGS